MVVAPHFPPFLLLEEVEAVFKEAARQVETAAQAAARLTVQTVVRIAAAAEQQAKVSVAATSKPLVRRKVVVAAGLLRKVLMRRVVELSLQQVVLAFRP